MTHTQTSTFGGITCLDEADLAVVAGGLDASSGYGSSLGASMAMVGAAMGIMATAPIVAGTLAVGSIAASAVAIYWGIKSRQ